MNVWLDTGNLSEIISYGNSDKIAGVTTNPSLLRTAGVTDYTELAQQALWATTKPISFEVVSDDLDEMERQARLIASWSPRIFVKVPITNTHGKSTISVISNLTRDGIQVNVTAVFTLGQCHHIAPALFGGTQSIVSVFAGRISDTGRDPKPIIHEGRRMFGNHTKVLWASPRSVYDYYQAQSAGADIITLPASMIPKLSLGGKDLTEYSLQTVEQFYLDAKNAGFTL